MFKVKEHIVRNCFTVNLVWWQLKLFDRVDTLWNIITNVRGNWYNTLPLLLLFGGFKEHRWRTVRIKMVGVVDREGCSPLVVISFYRGQQHPGTVWTSAELGSHHSREIHVRVAPFSLLIVCVCMFDHVLLDRFWCYWYVAVLHVRLNFSACTFLLNVRTLFH